MNVKKAKKVNPLCKLYVRTVFVVYIKLPDVHCFCTKNVQFIKFNGGNRISEFLGCV
jgi:hypothetical protein